MLFSAAIVMVSSLPAHGAAVAGSDPVGVETNPIVEAVPATSSQEAQFKAADEAATEHYEALLRIKSAHETGDWQQLQYATRDFEATTLEVRNAAELGPASVDQSAEYAVQNNCPDGDCSWAYLPRVTHTSQNTYYNCGPATGVMLVKGYATPSQSTMGSRMGTTTVGTGWATGPNAPIPTGLNYYLGGRDYTGIAVPSGGGTSSTRTTFESRLVSNTSANRGIAANIWQGSGTPQNKRLNTSYPSHEIFHIFAVRGYDSYGAKARYLDPASGGTGVSFSHVPKSGSQSTTILMPLLGARGYVW